MEARQKCFNLPVSGITHADQQKMAVELGKFVAFGKVVCAGQALAQVGEQPFFGVGGDTVGFDGPFGVEQPGVLGVHIGGMQAFGDPEFEVGIFAFIQVFVVGPKVVAVPAIVIHLFQNCQLHLIVKLLHTQQVRCFVWQECLGKFRELLQFASHGWNCPAS
ncbi:MAG: hypothetical protein IPM36_16500 [Lewinellaceae bacterium]|nr:hypothetical protein [Lewinellaceae bacterium]